MYGRLPWSHPAGLAALTALLPQAGVLDLLWLAVAVFAVLFAVTAFDALRRAPGRRAG